MNSSEQYLFLQGNEACVEGALFAGLNFFAGYPITPSTEIAELLAKKLPLVGGKFIQMEDEIASIAAVLGASIAGAKAMTATSGPGFSLMQELIGFACIAEVPCVIVNVQRLGPSTGGPTTPAQGDVLQSRWGTHGDHHLIVLAPVFARGIYNMTIRAFNLAEQFRVPVILLLDEIIAHTREKVRISKPGEVAIVNRKKPSTSAESYLPYYADETLVPALADFGEGYRFHITGLLHDETGFPTNDSAKREKLLERLKNKIENYKKEIITFVTEDVEDANVLLFAYGATARSALRAKRDARNAGMKVGIMIPTVIWPFPEEELKVLSEKVNTIIVGEMNQGQLIREVERAVCGKTRVKGIFKVSGEPITPEEFSSAIEEVYK